MKTMITLLCILSISCFATAGNGDNLLTHKINTKIHYPQLSTTEKVDAVVTVNLTVAEDGSLQVNKIESTNEEILLSIQNQLAQIRLKPGSDLTGKTYTYRFVLKVQQ